MKKSRDIKRLKRQQRVRKKVVGTTSKPRLSVFKSAKHIYAQIIDDAHGVTLVAASSQDKEKVSGGGNISGAKKVGELVAERAKAKKLDSVVFDRNGFQYHGRVKALADAAREKGLKF